MKILNNKFSIFDFSKKIATQEEWNLWHEKHSLVFQKFGSFLPAQTELLKIIYTYFSNITNPVSVFTAPPHLEKQHNFIDNTLLCKSGIANVYCYT